MDTTKQIKDTDTTYDWQKHKSECDTDDQRFDLDHGTEPKDTEFESDDEELMYAYKDDVVLSYQILGCNSQNNHKDPDNCGEVHQNEKRETTFISHGDA